MSIYYQPYEKKEISPKTKRVLKIIGLCLLLASVVLLTLGVLSILSLAGVLYLGLGLGLGIPCMVIGFQMLVWGIILIAFGFSRNSTFYVRRSGHFEEVSSTATVDKIVDISAIKCPHCGTVNKKESAFCKECGKSLEFSTTCPYCHAKVDDDSKYCPKCGHSL